MRNKFFFLILSLFFLLSSCSNTKDETLNKEIERGGALIDKIIYEVRTDMTIAIKDVADGRADLMASGIDGSVYLSLSERDLEKLDIYSVPSGSWSLLFNPVPNKAPYTVTTKDGKTYFNPFAIKEIRFAMNFLINRKKLMDEILRGAGEASFTHATPGQPGTYRYNLIPSKMGMTANGDEEKAIEDINNAMEKASNLPEHKGKLKKENGWWKYNGEYVRIKFVIRVDDPTGRLPAGNAITSLIEKKTGIKVEKLLYDRNKATQIVYGTDPKNYEWNIIIEAWGAGATRAWWDVTMRQMYVREGNYMPGANISEFWNYDNREASRISDKNFNGLFLTSDEYWNGNIRLQEIGLEDAVRIYLNSQMQFFVANKERFNKRMLYGVGDGINNWSVRSADIKPNRNGDKILRVLQHSAQGSLFISPWDPVGVGGFSDAYSAIMIGPCSDAGATFESPSTAKSIFMLGEADTNSLEIGVKAGNNGIPIGTIQVPQSAKMYNPYTQKWEEGTTIAVENGNIVYKKSDNITAYMKCNFKPKYFKWHHGIESTLADLMYGSVFIANIITKTNENDKYYDSAMAGRYVSAMDGSVGSVINEDGSFTLYGNYYWPMDMDRQIAVAAVSPKIGNPNRNTVIPFEINEAIMKLILEGSKSGNIYTISQDQSLNSIDVKNPVCVSDIKEKLIEMIDSKYIPHGIEDFITKEEAIKRYKAAIEFIDTYGHAYISNGPFFISKIDTKANYIELTAFKDYHDSAEYWINKLSAKMSRIEDIEMPSIANKNSDMNINIYVSSYDYPNNELELPDINTKVKLLLQLHNGAEKVYNAVLEDDVFKLTIPKEDLNILPKGNYIAVIESYIADETPYIETRTFILQ